MLKKKSKKGQGLTIIFSWTLAIFFTIIFFVFLKLTSCGGGPPTQKLFAQDLASLKVNYDLIAYLRTPVSYEGAEMTVADLIVLAMSDDTLAGGLLPFESTGVSHFLMDLSGLDVIDNTFDKYLLEVKGYPLTYTATNLMKTYNDYLPSPRSVKGYVFCSFKIDATKGGKKIVFYDARYSLYKAVSCKFEYELAEAKIPDHEGGLIDVKIKGTIDTGKIAYPALPLLAEILSIY